MEKILTKSYLSKEFELKPSRGLFIGLSITALVCFAMGYGMYAVGIYANEPGVGIGFGITFGVCGLIFLLAGTYETVHKSSTSKKITNGKYIIFKARFTGAIEDTSYSVDSPSTTFYLTFDYVDGTQQFTWMAGPYGDVKVGQECYVFAIPVLGKRYRPVRFFGIGGEDGFTGLSDELQCYYKNEPLSFDSKFTMPKRSLRRL